MNSDKKEVSREQLLAELDVLRNRITSADKTETEPKPGPIPQSNEDFKAMVEGIKDVIFRVSIEGILEYCSPVLKEFGGYDASQEVGQSIAKFFAKRIEYSRTLQRLKSAVVSKETTTIETMFMPQNRRPFAVEITSNPVISGGEVVAFLGVMRDISERREAEQENRRLEEKLIQYEKMEAIGRLAGGIAHDLNNVLSAVVGYPDLLLTRLAPDDPLCRPIQTIKRSGQKAAAVVDDLLTLARRGVRTRQVAHLNEVVQHYLKSPEYENLTHHYPNIRVEVSLEPGLFNINGSKNHLEKALMNLVTNAAESMPDGGKISISTLNLYPSKTAGDFNLEDYVVLVVSDDGIGFDAEDREKIFEPFYNRKMLNKSGGGLGMAVVWGTVQDHDGYINYESRKGKGSTFELYFPVSAVTNPHPEDERPISIQRYMGNGEHILVVDDGEEQREVTSNLLIKLGYRVHTVNSGEEAIDLCQSGTVRFDLAILDMIMGEGMDGLDTYKKMHEICTNARVLIVSGFSETDRVKEAQRLGAGDYIKKPCTLEQLGLAVKKALHK